MSHIRFTLPTYEVQHSTALSSVRSSVSTLSDPVWGQPDPTTIQGIGCYAVFVGGPQYKDAGTCQQTNNSTLSFGKAVGLFAPGAAIEIDDVPTGSETVTVVGLGLAANAQCQTNLFSGSSIIASQYSEPQILGQSTFNLVDGDNSININAAVTGSNVKLSNCNFSVTSGPVGSTASQLALLNSTFQKAAVVSYQSGNSPSQYTCIPLFTQTQDSSGNSASPPSGLMVTLTDSSATGAFYTDAACTATSLISFPKAQTSAIQTYFYKNTVSTPSTAFTSNLTATSNLLGSSTALQFQTPSGTFATSTSFPSPVFTNSSISPNQCVPLFYVNHATSSSTSAIAPYQSSFMNPVVSGVNFFSDQFCTTGVTTYQYPSTGASLVPLYLVYTGNSSSVSFGSLTVPVSSTASTPATLAMSAVSSTTSGTCTAVTLSLRDSNGVPVANSSAALSVPLSASGASGTFFQYTGCSTVLTSATIPNGAAGTTVYYQPTTVGALTLTATVTLPTVGAVTATAPITVAMAPPAKVLIRLPGQAFTPGSNLNPTAAPYDLFWGTPFNVEIILTDASYNPVSYAGSVAIGYAATASTPGATALTFVASDNGRKTISLAYTKIAYGNPAYVNDTIYVTVGAVSGASGTYTVATLGDSYFNVLGYMANGAQSCSPFTLYVADINKDPVLSANSHSFTWNSSDVTLWNDSACSASPISAGSNLTIPASSVSSQIYYMKTDSISAPVLTITSADLISPTSTNSLTMQKAVPATTVQYTAGNQYYDTAVQTPGSVAQNRCFPILVYATSDLGNIEFPISSPSTFNFALPASCPQIYNNSTCTTVASGTDLQMNTTKAVALLYSKATSSSAACTFTVATYSGTTYVTSPLPNHSVTNSATIH